MLCIHDTDSGSRHVNHSLLLLLRPNLTEFLKSISYIRLAHFAMHNDRLRPLDTTSEFSDDRGPHVAPQA